MELDLPNVFGEELRNRRESAGLSQEELAWKADVDRSYISQIELGKANPTIDIFYRLAEHINVTPGEFTEAVDNKLKESPRYSWLHKNRKPE